MFKSPIAIYGSDMIFHLQSKLFKADPYYFNANHSNEISISYAPSTSWRAPDNEPDFVKGIKNFYKISVRDRSTQNLVEEQTQTNPPIVCDPAFFVSYSNTKSPHSPLINGKKVVAIYGSLVLMRSYLPKSCLEGCVLKELAYFRRKNFFQSLRYQIQDPLEILNTFENSDFILCSTFHGVIMALITKRPFIAIANQNLLARLTEYQKFFSNDRIIDRASGNHIDINSLDQLLDNTTDILYEDLADFIEFSRKWYSDSLRSAISLIA